MLKDVDDVVPYPGGPQRHVVQTTQEEGVQILSQKRTLNSGLLVNLHNRT